MREPHAEIGKDLQSRLRKKDEYTFFLGTDKQFNELMELTWRYRGPERPPYQKTGQLEVNGEMFMYLFKASNSDDARYVTPHHVVVDYEVLEFDVKNVYIKVTSINGDVNRVQSAA